MKTITSKQLLTVSLGVIGFFVFLFLNAYVLKLDSLFWGVIQELITLPLLLAQALLLVVALIKLSQRGGKHDIPLLVSCIMLLISVTVTFGSFFVAS